MKKKARRGGKSIAERKQKYSKRKAKVSGRRPKEEQ